MFYEDVNKDAKVVSNDGSINHFIRSDSKARKDLWLVLSISLVALLFSMHLGAYEVIFHWSRQYDWFEIDEFFIATLVLFPGLVWFSHRRWKDASYLLNTSLQIQTYLEASQFQLTETLDENRRLLNRLSEIQEIERKNIASDLHDVFGQHLTAIHANAESIRSGQEENSSIYRISSKIISSSEQLSRLARLMLNELRPMALEKIGLDAALRSLVDAWKDDNPVFTITFSSEGNDKQIDMSIALAIYRGVQEGLTNILKHSKATEVSLFVNYESLGDDEQNNSVFLLLSDNGQGFVYPSKNEGLGLIGLRERIANVQGSCEIVTEPDKGTELSILVPKEMGKK